MKTCKGIECQLCIKACPTKALYWKTGEVAIIDDLCVYCTSCVLNCIVDDCIEVERRRNENTSEKFSTPTQVLALGENTNSQKRHDNIMRILPDNEAYLKRYCKPLFSSEAG